MTEYRFYQLGQSSLSQALMGILPKALERGMRAHILCASPERLADLDARLWTDEPNSFLPHAGAGRADDTWQPILLSANDNAPANGAKLLILTDGAATARAAEYDLVCVMLSGADETALAAGRKQWTEIKASGAAMSYWVQEAGKGWKQRA